jgi:hypothetical protein
MKQVPWCVILLLVAGVSAFPQDTHSKPQAPGGKAAARRAAPAVTAEDVQALRAALLAQQQQLAAQQQAIEEMRRQLREVQGQLQAAQSTSSAAQTMLAQAQTSAAEQGRIYKSLEADVTDMKAGAASAALGAQAEQKRLSALESALKSLRWTGDIRLRQDSMFLAGQNPRIRERIRVRLGIEGDLGQDFVGGIGLTTGTLADAISTNETLTNFFERKVIAFDRGFITYHPKAHPWLSLTGGKFAFTWQRTNQTFDPDLNPEGFSERLSFDTHHPVFQNVTFTAMQLLFGENSNTKFGVSGVDSFAVGGQVMTKLAIGKRWTITPSYALLNWRNENVILNAPAVTGGTLPVSGTSSIVCAPVTALGAAPVCSFAIVPYSPNGMTNSYRITAQAANGNLARQFMSRFLYSDLILENSISTGKARWPWRVLLEYENNLRAEAPLPGRSPQSHLYLAETSLGQTRNKGDFQFGYAWARQEQDSTIASFVESEQRLPTNVLQHRMYAQYRTHPRILLTGTLWVGRVLDSSLFAPAANPFGPADRLQSGFLAPGVSPGATDHYLKRIQFDVVYTF